MSFVAPPMALPDDEKPIRNAPFWPDIEPEDARLAMRIDDTITAIRLRHALVDAIANINADARAFRQAQQQAGIGSLQMVEAEQIDGSSLLLAHYRRAVYCLAKANLLERYRDFDTTASGERRAEQVESPIDDLRRDARWAVRALIGHARCTVELI